MLEINSLCISESLRIKLLTFIQSGDSLGFLGRNNVGIKYALIKNDFDVVILLNKVVSH